MPSSIGLGVTGVEDRRPLVLELLAFPWWSDLADLGVAVVHRSLGAGGVAAAPGTQDARDRAVCHLAHHAGLRVAEIVVDVAGIRLSARKGSVRDKGRSGGKNRTVPLHTQVRANLEELLDELGRPNSGPLAHNRDGGRLSARAADTVVSALGAVAGIGPVDDGEPFEAHVLRHTFGADLVSGR